MLYRNLYRTDPIFISDIYSYSNKGILAWNHMPCPSCGKDDHQRSSSAKCANRKRRIRETDLSANQEVSVYSVKKGLPSIVCPLGSKRDLLLETIRSDVKELSRLSIELSYLINHFYKRYASREDFYTLFPKFDALQFTYVLKGAKHKLNDPENVLDDEYLSYRVSKRFYDCKLRSFNVMQIASQYSTILETNVSMHAFKRLKRYMHIKYGDKLDKSEIHASTYDAYYNRVHRPNEIGEWFAANKIDSGDVKQNFWKHIRLFIRIQEELTQSTDQKSFSVFPIYSHGLLHITYDTRCVHELLRRVDPANTPSAWSKFSEDPKSYWARHFVVPPKFGYSFATDGVSVSLSMNRIVAKGSKFKSKRIKKDEAAIENSKAHSKRYSKIISVDPGAKTPIVTCTRSDDGGGGFEYKVLKKERVVYESKEHHRAKKRSRLIKDVEERVKADRENVERETGVIITRRSADVREYTRFQLKWFDEKQRVYEQRRLQRLKFDKYINDQKMLHKLVDEYFGKTPDTLVVYGAGFDFMNTGTFKGHRKFRHNDVLKIIRQRKNLSVFIINEAFTPKNCSKRYESGLQKHLHVSKSPHRYVYCSVCRKGIHRDKNGAKNILLKYEYTKCEYTKSPNSLSSIGTDMDRADGGSS